MTMLVMFEQLFYIELRLNSFFIESCLNDNISCV